MRGEDARSSTEATDLDYFRRLAVLAGPITKLLWPALPAVPAGTRADCVVEPFVRRRPLVSWTA